MRTSCTLICTLLYGKPKDYFVGNSYWNGKTIFYLEFRKFQWGFASFAQFNIVKAKDLVKKKSLQNLENLCMSASLKLPLQLNFPQCGIQPSFWPFFQILSNLIDFRHFGFYGKNSTNESKDLKPHLATNENIHHNVCSLLRSPSLLPYFFHAKTILHNI